MNPIEMLLLQIGLSDLALVLPLVVKNPQSVANLHGILASIRSSINLIIGPEVPVNTTITVGGK